VPEEDAESARRLRHEYEAGEADILSPHLLLFEVANALRYHPIVRFGSEELATAVGALRNMAILVDLDAECWNRTFQISHSEQISIYDAVYLALALQNDAWFVTADSKLHKGLAEDLQKHVLLISTLK
jgi:predicted nucleic acid-binding protein